MCDSLVAVGSETRNGRTLFAKNSDRPENECQPLLQFPEAFHSPGSRLRCTHIEIPQVEHTNRVLGHSPWWVWGFEHGVNEVGLAVGNHTVFSNEPVEEEPGLIGMDLVRLALERACTARDALDQITTLLAEYGQGGSAFAPGAAGYHNSFTIADPGEAWLLETTGRRFAARRARRDSLSNHFCLGRDWELASSDLEECARAEGLWDGADRLDVASSFRNPHVPGRISEPRWRRSQKLLREAGASLDVPELRHVLRDHGEGGPVRLPGSSPEDERFYTLCMHSEPVGTTTASLIAELPKLRSRPWPVWVSFGTPCTGIFLPVYVAGVIPPELAEGGHEPAESSAWWVFKRLQDAASRDFVRHTPTLRDAWSKLEERIEGERREVEAAASPSDPDAAASELTQFMTRTTAAVLEEARRLEAELV
jgi:dipeptidase